MLLRCDCNSTFCAVFGTLSGVRSIAEIVLVVVAVMSAVVIAPRDRQRLGDTGTETTVQRT